MVQGAGCRPQGLAGKRSGLPLYDSPIDKTDVSLTFGCPSLIKKTDLSPGGTTGQQLHCAVLYIRAQTPGVRGARSQRQGTPLKGGRTMHSHWNGVKVVRVCRKKREDDGGSGSEVPIDVIRSILQSSTLFAPPCTLKRAGAGVVGRHLIRRGSLPTVLRGPARRTH